MSPHRLAPLLITIVALLLLGMVVSQARSPHHETWAYEPPTYASQPLHHLTAKLAAIDAFEHEGIGDERNPFVPYQQRLAHIPPDPAALQQQQLPQKPEASLPVPEAPPLRLPPPTIARPAGPHCFGMIEAPRGRSVLVRMPGSDTTRRLEVGQSVSESARSERVWTLIEIERAGYARFRDPSGGEAAFVITMQDPLNGVR